MTMISIYNRISALILILSLWIMSACVSVSTVDFPTPVDTTNKPIEFQKKGIFSLKKLGVYADNQFAGARLNGFEVKNDNTVIAIIKPENQPINNSAYYAFNIWSDTPKPIYLTFQYPEGYKHRYIPKLKINGTWQIIDESQVFKGDKIVTIKLNLSTNPITVAAQEVQSSTHVKNWYTNLIKGKEDFVRLKSAGKSMQGRNLPVLDIYKGEKKGKDILVFLTRQHPPEVTGYYAFQYFLQTLLNSEELTNDFFNKYRVLAFPIVNPDGVDLGHWRHNVGGVDTNRDWSEYHQPEVKQAVKFISKQLKKDKTKLILGLDFHSTYKDIFYTNQTTQSTSLPDFKSEWFRRLEAYIPNYKVNEASNNSTKPVSKGWILYGHDAVGITYEIGDATPKDDIELMGRISARELMNILLDRKQEISADILIKNGQIYTGETNESINGVVAIKGDKIVYVGVEKYVSIQAKKSIDAEGMIVCPGFIDPHTHADRDLINPKEADNLPFLMQGVTTVVVGNDGNSLFPSSEFKELYESHGIGTNAILMAGHGIIRKLVVGRGNQKATAEELENMKRLVQQEMDAGAFGLSTGLFYAPGSYADTEEIIALAKVAAKNGGIYDSHIRDEGSYSIGLKSAIEEAIEIGRQAKLPIHISHIKCLGVDVWQQSQTIIDLIEKARKEGIDVTADQYPYDASATSLKAATVPRWAESGGQDSLFIRYQQAIIKKKILAETKVNIARRGGSDKLLVVRAKEESIIGKTLEEISNMFDLTPEQTVFKIIKNDAVGVASFNMTATDIHNFMKQSWTVTGSDGSTGHPRKYGSFPRKYHKYVLQEKVIDIATFINGSSAKTAAILKIPNRGQLTEGYIADVIVFNPQTFKDKSNFTDAFQLAEGLEYTILNGEIVVENGQFLNKRNGRVLLKNK